MTVLRDADALFSAGTVAGLNDDELLRRFTARHDMVAEVAFAAIVARHGPLVLAACRRALGDSHDAEDAFQATFLVLARRAEGVRGATLGPWLYGVARRIARRAKADALRCCTLDPAVSRRVAGADQDASAAAERAELAAVVDEELGRLSGRDRAPLILCDLGGLTHEQAAERLGWPVGTVKSRQARARGRLRERLARRGLAPAIAAALWESAAAARGAPPTRLVRSTVGAVQWFAVRGLAPPAGTVPATAVALAESILRGTIMTKLKLAGIGAALSLSAWIGALAVRGQDTPSAPPAAGALADIAPERRTPAPTVPKPPTEDADRLRVLENKLDRLLQVLERPGAVSRPYGATVPAAPEALAPTNADTLPATRERTYTPPVTTTVERRSTGAQGSAVWRGPDSKRLDDLEHRLSVVEQKLEQLMSRPQPAGPLNPVPTPAGTPGGLPAGR